MSNGNWIPDAVWENLPYGGIAGGIWVGGTEVLAVIVGNPDAAVVTIEPIDPSVTAPTVINFIATASGSGNLSYQWELDAVPIVDATLPTYDRTTQGTDNGKVITCTIVDGLGQAATSLPSTMTVALPPLPTVTIAPIDPAVFETEVIPFVATTTGTGVVVNTPTGAAAITLQWNLDGVPISGQQSSTYDRTTVLADNTKVITCTVTDTAGQVVESLPSTMTVTTPPAPVVTTQPVGATIVEATTHVLSVVVDGFAPLVYQWQQSVDGTNFTAISGATAASYTYTGVLGDPAGLIFRCNILDGVGQGVESANATMVVTQPTFSVQVSCGQSISSAHSGYATALWVWGPNGSITADIIPWTVDGYTMKIEVIESQIGVPASMQMYFTGPPAGVLPTSPIFSTVKFTTPLGVKTMSYSEWQISLTTNPDMVTLKTFPYGNAIPFANGDVVTVEFSPP